jgi:immunity protein 50 of polymorphic toxin system
METIETLIQGSEKLTGIFGNWPDFHDAEIMEVYLRRGETSPEKEKCNLPVFSVKLQTWQITREVDAAGFSVLRHRSLVTIRFWDVTALRIDDFNYQNAISGLSIAHKKRNVGMTPYFEVKFEPVFGMGAEFECLVIEVVEILPCDEDGEPTI